ncbi:MAG: hypothetical protein WCD80_04295 [Desulfobaccales bacterium]
MGDIWHGLAMKNPPLPAFSKEGNIELDRKSPPLQKGDLGGFPLAVFHKSLNKKTINLEKLPSG